MPKNKKQGNLKRILLKNWLPLLLLVLTIPSFISLIRPGFFPTHDFIYVARIAQMDKALFDGQFPVRWVPDFRYGEPLFNFYAPLPYYLGSFIHRLGLTFLETTKVLFGLSFVLSVGAMYLLGRELFGKWAAAVAAILYLYAPYRSVDVYVRGALNEAWTFVFFPLIFLFALKLVKNPNIKNLVLLSLSLAGLFFTHNIMTVLFAPFFGVWLIYLLVKHKAFRFLPWVFVSVVLGVGLGSSYLLPAFFERQYIQTDHLTVGFFDFRAHFVALGQFFSTYWGYGASTWGVEDEMSFQLGSVQWVALGILIAASAYRLIRRKAINSLLLIVLFASLIFSLFLQHNKSTFIWVNVPLLVYVQFPWRLMGISVFLAALLGGLLIGYFRKKKALLFGLAVILFALLVNYRIFAPESYYLDSVDEHYVSDVLFSQDDKLPKDYLPIWVKRIQEEKVQTPFAEEGQAEIWDFEKRSASASFYVSTEDEVLIVVPITYFPGWGAFINSEEAPLEEPSRLGLIRLKVPAGEHKIELEFANTPIRSLGDFTSAVSVGLILALLVLSRKGKKLKTANNTTRSGK